MPDEEKKGFRVVDRRGMADEEPAREESPPPPETPGDAGNRQRPEGVHEGKSPGDPASPVGGPSFLDLVMSLQMGAMVNLGMVQTSEGRRSPVNLPAAKDSIDLLDILKEKTKGNLDGEESQVLSEGLYHLRMAYVAAVKSGITAPGPGKNPGGKEP